MILPLTLAAIGTAQSFRCTPTRVWDGDGPIWCGEGPRVRLAGIAAREVDGRCRRGQPCPRAGGRAARDELVKALGGPRGLTPDGHVIVRAPTMRCRPTGDGRYGRVAAWCRTAAGIDLSCAQLRAGVALRWRNFGGDDVCRG